MSKEDYNWAIQKTRNALECMKGRLNSQVVDFFVAPPNGWLDRPPNRIDVLIWLCSSLAITLQVKSKEDEAEKFRQENPYKPVIAVKKGDTVADVIRMIDDIIDRCYKYIRRLEFQ